MSQVTLQQEHTTSQSTHNSSAEAEPVGMESLRELIPFAKEMLSQKPSRGLLRVYLVGSVFAVLGTVIGLVETVCHPFSSGEPLDAEMLLMMAREQRTVEAEALFSLGEKEEEEEEEEEEQGEVKELTCENGDQSQGTTLPMTRILSQRSMANRLHAS